MKRERLQTTFISFLKKYPLSKGFIFSREANRNSHEWLTWYCINTLYMMKLNDLYFVLLTFIVIFSQSACFFSVQPCLAALLTFLLKYFFNSILSNFGRTKGEGWSTAN